MNRRSLRAAGLAILAALPLSVAAQHPPLELPLAGEGRSRSVVAVHRASEAGLEVTTRPDAERSLIPWSELDLDRAALEPHDLMLLNEARKTVRSGGEMPFPLGLAVDEALRRGAWAPPATPPATPAAAAAAGEDTADPGFDVWRDCRLIDNPFNSGDSFQIRTSRGEDFILRLYFVDAPEVDRDRATLCRAQARALGLTQLENEAIGCHARAVTRTLLGSEPFTVLTARAPVSREFGAALPLDQLEQLPSNGTEEEQPEPEEEEGEDPSPAARQPYVDPLRARPAAAGQRLPAILGFVVLAGRASTSACEPSLGDELVARGLARRSEPQADPPGPQDPTSIDERLRTLEERAQEARLGAWALSRRNARRN